MNGMVTAVAIASLGAAALPGMLSVARLVDAAVSLLFVFWLGRFAGRVQRRREAERRAKVVPFPGPGRE